MTLEHCLEWSMLGYYTVRTYISWLGNRRNTKDNPFSFSFGPLIETIWKVNSDLCRRNEPTKHGQSPDGTPADAPAADGAPADDAPADDAPFLLKDFNLNKNDEKEMTCDRVVALNGMIIACRIIS